MPWFPNRSKWNLIIDEIPDIDFEHHLNVPDTSDFAVQSVLQASECGMNTMLKLTPRPEAKAKVDLWARNPGDDDLIRVVQPLFRELTNRHSQVFITRASWNRLGWQGHGQVAVHGWRSPSVCDGWSSVRIMGAFFEMSLLYMIWSNLGVEFKSDKQIKVAAHRHGERIGKRVAIHYFSERNWSKSLRDKIAIDADPLAHVKPILSEVMGQHEFLISMNNDIEDTVISIDYPNAIRIPAVCHGLNEYQNIDKIAFLSALNNTPGHFSYADAVLGISPDQLKQARAHQVAYQSIMRTALRDADSTAQVTVLVPDIALANWLTDVFPGSSLYAHEPPAECKQALGDAGKSRGRPRKESVLSPVERNALSVEKQRRLLITKNTLYKAFFVIELSHETTIFSTHMDRSAHLDWDDVRSQLRKCLDEAHPKKEANTLVSGAMFDPTKCQDTNKGLGNIVGVNGIWLDFDGGSLMPNDFARMFTDVRWLLWNSFNNGKDGETKFRVLFPTSTPMTAEMYQGIWDAIATRIRDFGYFVGSGIAHEKAIKAGRAMPPMSGLDVSKRTPCSFFYMPCRAGLGTKFTFWREHWGAAVPLLNPDLWISYAPLEGQQYEIRVPHQNAADTRLQRVRERLTQRNNHDVDTASIAVEAQDRAKVAAKDRAIADCRAAPKGTGNDAFYRLGCRLKALGMDDLEVRATLEHEAAYAKPHSQADRRRQIPSIMTSLRRTPDRRAA
ncbi:MAG: hypothetical protein WCJ64_03000 [Rhodospirillaceae bacterium]